MDFRIYPNIKLILQKKLIKNVIENAAFVCPFKQLKKAIQSNNYKVNYEIVPNVVNTAVFKPNENKKELPFTFLHVSTLTDEIKNISGILTAYSQLDNKNTLLRIIGDGETNWIEDRQSP